MDSDELVDHQINAGARLITQLVRDGFEIKAAFWVKTAEQDIWFLYVATPLVEHKGLAATYRILQASILRLQDIPLSLFDVKLVGADNPITRDVVAILNRSSGHGSMTGVPGGNRGAAPSTRSLRLHWPLAAAGVGRGYYRGEPSGAAVAAARRAGSP